jgi:hypothetical protein
MKSLKTVVAGLSLIGLGAISTVSAPSWLFGQTTPPENQDVSSLTQVEEVKPTRTPEEMKELADYIIQGYINDGVDLDCDEFDSHEVAQNFYKWSVDYKGYDLFGLDADSDGAACENLLY